MSIDLIVSELLARPTLRRDLTIWLSFEAFQNVPGWLRWDTGDIGYSYPLRPDEEEGPALVLSREEVGVGWHWEVYGPEPYKGRLASGASILAGKAAEEGLEAFQRLFPEYKDHVHALQK